MNITTYYIIGGVAFLFSLGVRSWLGTVYRRWGRVANQRGLPGGAVARVILDANGLVNVPVEGVRGRLTDHYDPRTKIVRLSESNYGQPSVAGLAVAAHEVGHAIQDFRNFGPLRFRSAILPLASLGGRFGPMAALFGLFMGSPILLQAGIVLFAGAVAFQLITLPVEFDASRRALSEIERLGLASEGEREGAKRVLTAAAMTYVAAVATSLGSLLYLFALSRRKTE